MSRLVKIEYTEGVSRLASAWVFMEKVTSPLSLGLGVISKRAGKGILDVAKKVSRETEISTMFTEN